MGINIAHPAAREELAHFSQALSVIGSELSDAEDRLSEARAALNYARRADPDNLPVREMQFALSEQSAREMKLATKKPYFTRIDFTERAREPHTYYIGKQGVTLGAELKPYIIDWRAPIANLYYSGQVGPMSFESPDGQIEGELTLKRQFSVDDGELKAIFDAGIAAVDEYLQSVLGSVTGERLTEIVTTIQAEQNAIIRHPLKRNAVVQGVAGSGKTSIALHRIAYLLYAYQGRLKAENTLILAPNPMFLQYIAPVLPDLGVERVKQTTYLRLIGDWLSAGELKLEPGESRVAKTKGKLATVQALAKWLDDYEARILPSEGLSFGPVELYSGEALRQFMLVDEAPFPLDRRFKELKKQLSGRVKGAADKIKKWYTAEAQRRAAKLPPEKVTKLFESLEARVKRVDEEAKSYVKDTMSAFRDFSPASVYKLFWEDMKAGDDPELREAAEYTLSRKKREAADVALTAIVALRTAELPRLNFSHVVVDEAQDLSQAEFAVLRKLNPSATFTIVGDMMQGINSARGLAEWDELAPVIEADRLELIVSYRSTIEIIALAKRVWRNFNLPSATNIEPVLRHGEEPDIIKTDDLAGSVADKLAQWSALKSVMVITKTGAQADALVGLLPGAKRLDVTRDVYETGILVGSASEVKGLEFDGVIIAGADDKNYRAEALDAKLLYVALTRALHRMCVIYEGEITGLLRE